MAKFPIPMPPPREMLRRRGKERRIRILFGRLCLLGAALCILFSKVVLLYRSTDIGMYPTVQAGDLVLANRIHGKLETEDLVLYRAEGLIRLGRIVALEGDEVLMENSGSLLVNGSVQNGKSLFPTYARPGENAPQHVPKGMIYVLGDHRTQSWDSRDHGCIWVENVLGKVIGILRTKDL